MLEKFPTLPPSFCICKEAIEGLGIIYYYLTCILVTCKPLGPLELQLSG